MTVLFTLTTAGSDTGPFDLYSNLNSYAVPFAVGITKAALQAGYTSAVVPDYTTIVRIKSKGVCTNHVNITLTNSSYLKSLARGTSNSNACLNANSL